MIDELFDGNLRSQFGQAAEVIAMPVRDDQMIDLLEAGVFHGRHDSRGVSRRLRAGIAGVDEQRFARRRNEERRIAALHIDDIDVECLRRAERGQSDE